MFTKIIIPLALIFAIGCTKKPDYSKFKFTTASFDMVQNKSDSRHPASGALVPLLTKTLPMIASQTGQSVNEVEKAIISIAKARGIIAAGSNITSISKMSAGQRTFFTEALYNGELAGMHKYFKNLNGQKIILSAMENIENPVLQAQYPVPAKVTGEKLVSSGAGYATDKMLSAIDNESLVKAVKDGNILMKQAGVNHPIVADFRIPITKANAFFAQNTGEALIGTFCKTAGGKYDLTISDSLVPVYYDVINQANTELVTFMQAQGLTRVTDPDTLALVLMKAQMKVTKQPAETAVRNVAFLSQGGTQGEACDLYGPAIGGAARRIASNPAMLAAVVAVLGTATIAD